MKPTQEIGGDQLVKAAFARIDAVALGAALGVLLAALLWLATVYLLIKGAPPGQHIGPHLGLLSNYLPGYSVTWPGSLFGFFHGAWIGFVVGAFLAAAWNLPHHIWLMLIVRRHRGWQTL
jgi:hypothetical protein